MREVKDEETEGGVELKGAEGEGKEKEKGQIDKGEGVRERGGEGVTVEVLDARAVAVIFLRVLKPECLGRDVIVILQEIHHLEVKMRSEKR